ncbi:hypothetical protein M0R45_014650 [Rubus argutus]|uniref:Uncharacterized protein n=1 Tax=Rubus argutus TaxID=59490 RepID=A0AAW1XM18_RUBAR
MFKGFRLALGAAATGNRRMKEAMTLSRAYSYFKAHIKPSLPQQSLPSDSGFDNAKVSTSLLGALSILVSISPQIRSCYSQLAIPVTAPNIPDPVVWLYSKNGAFTVKSGYHFQNYEDVAILIILVASLLPSGSGLEFALNSKIQEFLVASYSWYPPF